MKSATVVTDCGECSQVMSQVSSKRKRKPAYCCQNTFQVNSQSSVCICEQWHKCCSVSLYKVIAFRTISIYNHYSGCGLWAEATKAFVFIGHVHRS